MAPYNTEFCFCPPQNLHNIMDNMFKVLLVNENENKEQEGDQLEHGNEEKSGEMIRNDLEAFRASLPALPEESVDDNSDKLAIKLNVQDYTPEELSVSVSEDNRLIVEGKHEEEAGESRHFVRMYALPESCSKDNISSEYDMVGNLNIKVPKEKENPPKPDNAESQKPDSDDSESQHSAEVEKEFFFLHPWFCDVPLKVSKNEKEVLKAMRLNQTR